MFFYSVALEVAQTFIPERHAEIRDLLWDAIGIGLGQVCYRITYEFAKTE
jgi:VanZ family protein